jgi:hypothetical protein
LGNHHATSPDHRHRRRHRRPGHHRLHVPQRRPDHRSILLRPVVSPHDQATTSGQITASFAVPSGFAGSTIPGRHDTFQAKGRQSGKVALATFTVTG